MHNVVWGYEEILPLALMLNLSMIHLRALVLHHEAVITHGVTPNDHAN